MAYIPKSLHSIINEINRTTYLPHIQRPFVWEIDQMSKLLDSLMRGYPVQTMLFWKTKEGIKARKFMDSINPEVELHTLYDSGVSQNGVEKLFVLDGQQRIQTLYCIYKGSIINERTKIEEEAYIDITSREINDATNQVYNIEFKPINSNPGLPLFRVRDVLTVYDRQNSEEISDNINDQLDTILLDSDDNKKNRERAVRKNVGQLLSILREDKHFWVEELDGIANNYPYKTVLEVFVRVNSGGTKLSSSDLMFAAMKELSANIEENLELVADTLNNNRLGFETETVLKAILLVNNKGASVDPEKFSGTGGQELVKEIDDDWDTKYKPAFEALRDFIVVDLKLDSEKLIRSYNSFIPIFEYFFHNPTPSPANKSRLKSFFYKAQLFNWFRAQTDGLLEYLHNKHLKDIKGKDFPISDINDYFSKNRNQKSVFDMASLTEHSLRYFLLHLLYVEINSQSAFTAKMKNNAPHIDHIYPKSKLAKAPLSLSNDLINHIGNYRFIGATDNIKKRVEAPDSYFIRMKNSNIDISRHLLVESFSVDPATLTMDVVTYDKFRTSRTNEIYNIIEPKINFV